MLRRSFTAALVLCSIESGMLDPNVLVYNC